MSADSYLSGILANYQLATGVGSAAYNVRGTMLPIIQRWAGNFLLDFSFSGSYAKGTGVKGSTDVDLFISLDPHIPKTLGAIYESLFTFLQNAGYNPRRQNVSIRVMYTNLLVDLVPARKQLGYTNDHSLYKQKTQTWTLTNFQTHINLVAHSGRLNEIRAIKIWRQLNNLDFPSFYLELATIDALSGRSTNQLADNVWATLIYLRDKFSNARFVDPANTANIISDDLTPTEKMVIANAAGTSLTKQYWSQVIW
jgi:hypothetical protein